MKKLILLGSGEYTDILNDVDSYLLSDNKKNVVLIPLAAGKEDNAKRWIEKGEIHFNTLGATTYGIDVYTKEDVDSFKNFEILDKADIIYFSQGDPNYLYEALKDTDFWKKIKEKYESGTYLAGSSAGAMILGNYILTNMMVMPKDFKFPEWKKSFSLLNYSIIPQFDMVSRFAGKTFLEKIFRHSENQIKEKWIGIDEDTVMIVTDENFVEVRGKRNVHVFFEGIETIYKPGSTFLLV